MKNRELYNSIEENRDIMQDITSLLSDEKSMDECEHLKTYLSDNNNRQNFKTIINEIGSSDEFIAKVNKRDREKDKEILMRRLTEASTRRTRTLRRLTASISTAAAALLVSF